MSNTPNWSAAFKKASYHASFIPNLTIMPIVLAFNKGTEPSLLTDRLPILLSLLASLAMYRAMNDFAKGLQEPFAEPEDPATTLATPAEAPAPEGP
ncbi:MAG: hypothetical protein LRY39_01475 [Alphaproteobacteria bacterium]|nr:hypothetical protein [Alphaproteobacteria bacterium]